MAIKQGPTSLFVDPDALRQSELLTPAEMDYGPAPVDPRGYGLDPETGKARV